MPIYQFACRDHGEFEAYHDFDRSADPEPCSSCGCHSERVYGGFNFIEDRTRMYRNPRTGTRFSDVLGCEMPEDRRARDTLYSSRGIEPVSPREMPSQWKTALEYANHLKAGGQKLDKKAESALIDPPDFSGVKSIRQMMDESGYRGG